MKYLFIIALLFSAVLTAAAVPDRRPSIANSVPIAIRNKIEESLTSFSG